MMVVVRGFMVLVPRTLTWRSCDGKALVAEASWTTSVDVVTSALRPVIGAGTAQPFAFLLRWFWLGSGETAMRGRRPGC
jgi:hypothetical protein